MYILQFSPPRVNVQTTYRFQSFLSQYVSLLDTKSPGERGTPRGCVSYMLNQTNAETEAPFAIFTATAT